MTTAKVIAATIKASTACIAKATTTPKSISTRGSAGSSIATAKKNGLNIANQKGRQFKRSDFDTFDYIFVMDNHNYSDVIDLAKNEVQKNKVQLILNEIFPNENVDVPDPYFGLANGFDIVYEMLDEACQVIAQKLIEKHSQES